MDNDLYSLLGLLKGATSEEIKRAYHEAARRFHPDVNVNPGETELFLEIKEAYETLSNPKSRAAYDASSPPAPDLSAVKVTVSYSRATLLRSEDPQLIYVLLDLAPGPKKIDDEYPPLNVSLVLDRSTSMRGERMDTVKNTAIELIRHLRPKDILSIVTFNDRAEVLVSAGDRRNQGEIETIIRMLQPSGGTEIFQGLETGLHEVRRNLRSSFVNHIILLTDGRTYGDEAASLSLADEASWDGIAITGLGIGNEWNDAFIDSLAARTGGSSLYVSKPSDIDTLLKQKFRKLSRIYAERVTFNYHPKPNVELRYAFRVDPEPGILQTGEMIHLGVIPREASLRVIFEFLVSSTPTIQPMVLMEGRLNLEIPNRGTAVTTIPISLARPISNSPDTEPPPPDIVQALSGLTLYRMQENARQDAAKGNFLEATRRLEHLATHLLACGERNLAYTVMVEADNLQQNQAFSDEGEKRIKFGTRALILRESTENKLE
jgi:Ca-activated chloride channel family protein